MANYDYALPVSGNIIIQPSYKSGFNQNMQNTVRIQLQFGHVRLYANCRKMKALRLYSMTVLAGFLCFMTFIIILKIGVQSDGLPFFQGSSVFPVKYAFGASAAVVFPLLARYSIEINFQGPEISASTQCIGSFLLLMLIIDLLYVFQFSNDDYSYLNIAAIICIRRSLSMSYVMMVMNTTFPKIWSLRWTSTLIISFLVIQLLICLRGFVSSDQSLSALFILQVFLEILFILLFLWSIRGVIKYLLLSNDNSDGEQGVTKIATVMTTCICTYIFYSTCSGGSWVFDKTNNSFLIFDINVTTIILVIISIWNEILLKAELDVIQNIKIKDINCTVARYLSHQIRTPINTVALALQCLRSYAKSESPTSPEDTTELVDDALNSVFNVTTVLENIITYESLLGKTLKLYQRTIDPSEYFKDIFASYSEQARKKNLEYTVFFKNKGMIDIDFSIIYIDSIRFYQIMHTLVMNAIKYTKKGGKVNITVEYCSKNDDFNYPEKISGVDMIANHVLKVRIVDTGRGIFKENLPGLFERSLQFNPGLEEKDQGSGLSLWKSDGPGKGSTFVLSLPIYIDKNKEKSHKNNTDNNINNDNKNFQISNTSTKTSFRRMDTNKNDYDEVESINKSGDKLDLNGRYFEEKVEVEEEKTFQDRLHVGSIIAPSVKKRQTLSCYDWRISTSDIFDKMPSSSPTASVSKRKAQQKASFTGHTRESTETISPRWDLCQSPSTNTFLRPLHSLFKPSSPEKIHNTTTTSKTTSNTATATTTTAKRPLPLTSITTATAPLMTPVNEHENPNEQQHKVLDTISNFSSISNYGSGSNRISTAVDAAGGVLVVSNDTTTLKMIVRVMKSKCKFITEAKDGAEAVERMKEAMEPGNTPFHFVMMDYQMPVMDGPSAAKAMREMGFTGPIIGVTGNVVKSDVSTFLEHGADDVLSKPLSLHSIATSLGNHGISLPTDKS